MAIFGYLLFNYGNCDAPDDVHWVRVDIFMLYMSDLRAFCYILVSIFKLAAMYAYSYLVLNIVVFRISVVSALDVRIETIEDDGTRDVWTFEDSSLKSQLRSLH